MKYTLALLLMLISVSPVLAFPALPSNKTDCEATGGKWVKANGLSGTMPKEFCIILATDAGKHCNAYGDCSVHKCVFHPDADGMCEDARTAKSDGCEEMEHVSVEEKNFELTCQ